MQDKTILEHINALVEEEKRLRADPSQAAVDPAAPEARRRTARQCWDLCASGAPRASSARIRTPPRARDVDTVEKYLQ
jgi:hypothetical protein